jgi:hypothetical protein
MIKDALIISVIAALFNYLIKSSSVYVPLILNASDKGLSIEQVDSMMTFLVAFVSVILGNII